MRLFTFSFSSPFIYALTILHTLVNIDQKKLNKKNESMLTIMAAYIWADVYNVVIWKNLARFTELKDLVKIYAHADFTKSSRLTGVLTILHTLVNIDKKQIEQKG